MFLFRDLLSTSGRPSALTPYTHFFHEHDVRPPYAPLHSRDETNARKKAHLLAFAATSTGPASMTRSAQQQQVVSQWTLPTTKGIQSLTLVPDATLESLAPDEVRVRLHAASLNYRDLVIAKVSNFESQTCIGRV